MDVLLKRDGDTIVVSIAGRINTATSPQFERELIPALDGVKKLVLDMTDLLYISSAGLRVILTAQKIMARQGEMILRNLKPEVYEVFEMTGFVDFLTIE